MTPDRRHRIRKFQQRMASSLTCELDQMQAELTELAGVNEGFPDIDLWQQMHDLLIDQVNEAEAGTPKRARALCAAIGMKYWLQQCLLSGWEDDG